MGTKYFYERRGKRYGLRDIQPLSDKDIKLLAEELGVEELPDGEIDFSNIKFEEIVNFSKFIFPQATTFKDTTFKDTTFTKETDFSGAIFSSDVNFIGTTFIGVVYFMRATLIGHVDFKAAIFTDTVSFDRTTFTYTANFEGVVFVKFCNFVGTRFLSSTSFNKGCFNEPPNFSGAAIHQDTSFHKRNFVTKKYINVPNDYYDAGEYYDDVSRRWRVLKNAMNQAHNRYFELKFFGYELDARIEIEKCRTATLLRLYKWSSKYGTGILRPFVILFLFMIAFALIYAGFITEISCIDAFSLSIANSVPFVNNSKYFATEALAQFHTNNELFKTFQILGVFQNVISIIFIFLIGLGLRNKFSIK